MRHAPTNTQQDKMHGHPTPSRTVLLGVVADVVLAGEHDHVQGAVVEAPPGLVALGHAGSEIGGIPQRGVEASHCGHSALAW